MPIKLNTQNVGTMSVCLALVVVAFFFGGWRRNERWAGSMLSDIEKAEKRFESEHGKGNFAGLPELVSEGLIKEPIDKGEPYDGYIFAVETGPGFYKITAKPAERADGGCLSFHGGCGSFTLDSRSTEIP